MTENKFIGRSEVIASKILYKLLGAAEIKSQYPISKIMTPEDYSKLDEVYKKHKFDFYIVRHGKKGIIVEINYKHGNTAARKWGNVFLPIIQKAGLVGLAINDWECRSSLSKQKGLFHLDINKNHHHTWNDYRDVIDALEQAGIEP